LGNLEEIDKFLDTYDHPRLNQEDINHLNKSITHNEIEAAIKHLQKKKIPGPDRFSTEFHQTFKKEYQCSLNFSMKLKEKELCLSHFMKPVLYLSPNQTRTHATKGNYRTIFSMNKCKKASI
jgi:hypothetical protein